MNGRTSRLNTLMRVRRIQEDVARAQLLTESAAERAAQDALGRAHGRYAAPEAEPPADLQEMALFLAERQHRDALAGSVRLARAGADAAAEATGLARDEWSEAAMRMAALERLEERAADAARTERLAAEQRTSEESSSATRADRSAVRTAGGRP